jgi:hypothetical protein
MSPFFFSQKPMKSLNVSDDKVPHIVNTYFFRFSFSFIIKKMFSFTVFRNTAMMVASKHAQINRILPVCRRVYTTTNDGEPKNEASAKEQPMEETKVEADIPEEIKNQLAEKDKKISELQVKKKKRKRKERDIKQGLQTNRMHTFAHWQTRKTFANVVVKNSRQPKNMRFKSLQRTC